MNLYSAAIVGLSLLAASLARADGDSAAGQQKAAVCAACHGIDGNSVVAQWPKLAGQHPAYLARQVRLIRDGARMVPEMAGIVAGLSDTDIDDLAAWYSTQPRGPGVADPALITLGERIYRAGNAETALPACMACHGPAGEGNPLAGYPALAGQHALYVSNALTRFRSGQTWGAEDNQSKVMAGVAAPLSQSEIEAVASYIQGLHQAGD